MLRWLWEIKQLIRMKLCLVLLSARLICLSKIVKIAWRRLSQIFHYVEKGQFYDSLMQLSPTPAPAPSSNTTSSSSGVANSPNNASPSSEGNSDRTSRIVSIVAVVIGALTTLY